MPAYVIFLRESPIHDPEEMAAYRANSAPEVAARHGMKPLVVYGAQETIEGEGADGMVVLEFPTLEDARTWYFSEEYQNAAKHRRAAADYRGFIVEGFAP